jgi:Arc/MetJ family transcription regulator
VKTTIDIPEKVLAETLRHTGARTKKKAILIALEQFNLRCRREQLAERLHGSMPNFMTQEDLKTMREE